MIGGLELGIRDWGLGIWKLKNIIREFVVTINSKINSQLHS
jgi:hypothetical protein